LIAKLPVFCADFDCLFFEQRVVWGCAQKFGSKSGGLLVFCLGVVIILMAMSK
jgi:hypothetical protein